MLGMPPPTHHHQFVYIPCRARVVCSAMSGGSGAPMLCSAAPAAIIAFVAAYTCYGSIAAARVFEASDRAWGPGHDAPAATPLARAPERSYVIGHLNP